MQTTNFFVWNQSPFVSPKQRTKKQLKKCAVAFLRVEGWKEREQDLRFVCLGNLYLVFKAPVHDVVHAFVQQNHI